MNSSNNSLLDSLDQIEQSHASSKSLDIRKDDKPLIVKSQFLNYKKNCKIMNDSLSRNQDSSAYIIIIDDSEDESCTENKETYSENLEFIYSDSEIIRV